MRSLSSEETFSGRGKGIFGSVTNKLLGAVKRGSKVIKNVFHFKYQNDYSEEELEHKQKVLDPQGAFLQRWNKIFVLSCVIAVSVDPLFFYIPVVNIKGTCIDLDKTLAVTASVLRTFTDIFYILHIIFQFRTGFVAPSSRVFGRGVLVKDSSIIARRYLSSCFLIDILAVLPLPQVSNFCSVFILILVLQTFCSRESLSEVKMIISVEKERA